MPSSRPRTGRVLPALRLALLAALCACPRPSPVPLDAGPTEDGGGDGDGDGDAGQADAGLAPPGWRDGPCAEDAYQDGAVCDCGCGAPDPDCLLPGNETTPEACDLVHCPPDEVVVDDDLAACEPPVCGDGLLEGLEQCEPAWDLAVGTCGPDCRWADVDDWSCDPAYYGAFDGCDCGCGQPDPDCEDLSAGACRFLTGCLPDGATGPDDVTQVPSAADPSSCVANTCGDGFPVGGEACDDGNNAGGDGCAADCTLEAGWVCALDLDQPPALASVCQPVVCGDGYVAAGFELCDDGNTQAGDGCDPGCVPELDGSCQGRCGDEPPSASCYCDESCLQFGDCCPDYYDEGCFQAPPTDVDVDER